MPRDYSSRRNNPSERSGKRKPPKRAKPAATPLPPKSGAGRKKPVGNTRQTDASPDRFGARGWIWVACGLLIAIVAGSFYYIASRPAGHGPESVSIDLPGPSRADDSGADSDAASKPSGDQASDQSTTRSQPRFAFYKMLPNYKVKVPANQQPAKAGAHEPHEAEANTPEPTGSNPPSSSAASHRSTATAEPAANTPQGHAPASGYVIQAGAFSARDDADHRKARLALLGVTAEIVDVHTAAGKTVYRVQSQAVPRRTKARSLAQRLKSHGIETMIRHPH